MARTYIRTVDVPNKEYMDTVAVRLDAPRAGVLVSGEYGATRSKGEGLSWWTVTFRGQEIDWCVPTIDMVAYSIALHSEHGGRMSLTPQEERTLRTFNLFDLRKRLAAEGESK